jgi:hypothetical protein
MTDEPEPEDPHAAESEPSKVPGCFTGGLATVGAIVVGTLIGGIIAGAIGAGGAPLGLVLVIALLVGAGYYWRATPGFVLGIGLTIGIILAIGTACTTLFLV